MTFVKSSITGRALISCAFGVGGGVLADRGDIAMALAKEAEELGQRLKTEYVELRSEKKAIEGWSVKDDVYAGFYKPLETTEEEMLKAIPRKRRAEIRKAFKIAGEGQLNCVFDKDVDRFFDLYSRALRDLGTPVFPKKFARAIIETFDDSATIACVEHEGKPISALISFYHHGRVMPYYVGALPQARHLRAFDYIYWQQMCEAMKRGATQFDFGRSKFEAGSFGYKKTWGIEPVALEYQYHLPAGGEVPNINPNNPKYSLATKVWSQLPVPIATIGGSLIARHFA